MTKLICTACGKPIRANTAAMVAHTAVSTQRWHLACCPLGRDPALEDGKDKDRAAA